MLTAVKGVVKNNHIVTEDDIMDYEGQSVIITFLDIPVKQKKELDFDSYVTPTERGKRVEEYMREMRENDRL